MTTLDRALPRRTFPAPGAATPRAASPGTRAFYSIYQFLVPLLLFPLAYRLWLGRFDGDHRLTAFVLFVPVVAYYVFVIVGIRHFRLWEINTRLRVGGFRPHHGFVFGTGSALLLWATTSAVPVAAQGPAALLSSAFLGASVFGFWNWWYETYAIKSGFISIYTRKMAEGASAEEAVTDYAPVLFGTMGAVYAVSVKLAETMVQGGGGSWILLTVGALLAMIFLPVIGYDRLHRWRTGESGLVSYIEQIKGTREI